MTPRDKSLRGHIRRLRRHGFTIDAVCSHLGIDAQEYRRLAYRVPRPVARVRARSAYLRSELRKLGEAV